MDSQQATLVGNTSTSLSEEKWLALAEEHERVVGPYIDAYRDRRSRRAKHPVHDFLFTYYQTNRTVLRRWRPAPNQTLQGEQARSYLDDSRYREGDDGVGLDFGQLEAKELDRIAWVARLIRAAQGRAPRFNCFGLHEWAMIYRADEIRHETTPLRLSKEKVAQVVESSSIRCSHFDAFRFFTPEAVSLNELQPRRDDREKNEQFGCIHFNMDLYRWSYKGSPWIGSDLLRECFQLALQARELDMRASPYDLTEYGYSPIRIEEPEGREIYSKEQLSIYRSGQALAKKLLDQCDYLVVQAGKNESR